MAVLAFLLWNVLQAHGGVLPPYVHVVFANTGKEKPETLDFIHQCETQWGIKVHWLEWQKDKPRYRVVNYETADRTGKPFAELIEWKRFLPNNRKRICTQYLKVLTMARFIRDQLVPMNAYSTLLGIRYDEPRRWRILGQDEHNSREYKIAPLVETYVTKQQVMDFWSKMPFDLQLRDGQGNCDLCFMKGAALRDRLIREDPSLANWWIQFEQLTGTKRRVWSNTGPTYTQLLDRYHRKLPVLPDLNESEVDCNCTD